MRALPTAIAVIALVGAGFFAWNRLHASQGPNPPRYKVATIQRTEVRRTVSASGTLQPWTTVDVKSKAGGRINLLAVDVGSSVRQGQIIARIDPADSQLTYSQASADTDSAKAKQAQSAQTYGLQVDQSRIAIEQAQASLQSAVANARQVEARYRTAGEENKAQPSLTRAAIAQAQAVYVSALKDRAKLNATQVQDQASAQSAYDQAIANHKSSRLDYERQKSLLARGFVSGQTVDQAEADTNVKKAQIDSAKAKLDTLSAEQRAAREASDAQVEQALAAYRSAQTQSYSVTAKRNSLSESYAAVLQARAQVASAKAALDQAIADRRNDAIKHLDIRAASASTERARASLVNAKETLDQTTVRAPSEGVVLQKYVEQGTIITSGLSLNSTGTSIVQIGDVSRMYVDVSVDETDIASVAVGQSVDVSLDAYSTIPFHGKVIKISPLATTESNVTTIHVRVEVDNGSPSFRLLKPNMNATCEFVVSDAKNVLAVPTEALKTDSGSSYIEIAVGGKPAATSGLPPDPDTLVGIKVERRSVQPGVEGNDLTEIRDGVREGEIVVVETIVDDGSDDSSQPTTKAAFGGGGPGGPPPGGPPGGGRR